MLMRYDTAPINNLSVDPLTGFLHASNVPIARTGVFPYLKQDGSIVMEAKTPSELLTDSTVQSANNKPVTDDHPPNGVNSANASQLMKGITADNAHVDGDKLKVDMTISDKDLIHKIQNGKQELSIGFQTDVAPVSGDLDGMKYDAVQRNIQINHVAVVEHGRAGHSVRLTGDSAEMVQDSQEQEGQQMETTKVRLDGADVTVATADADRVMKLDADNTDLAAQNKQLQQQVAALKAQLAKLQGDSDSNKKSADEAQAKSDSLEKELTDLKKKFEGDGLDKAIAARMDLIDKVKPYVGDSFDFNGKSAKDIKLAAVKRTDSVDLSDKSDDYIDAYFDALTRRGNAGVVGYNGQAKQAKTDSADVKDRYHLA